MPITQKDVADALDISVITVSRALRGHPDLAESTRERILQKAREIGYTRVSTRMISDAPQALPRRVGIFFYDAPERHEDPLASGVKRQIFLSLQKECQRLQVETMIETPTSDALPLLIKNNTINAAFIFGRYTPESIKHFQDIPALAVSSFIDCPALPRVIADNVEGIRLVTEHLIKLGHKNILFIGNDDTYTRIFEERSDSYVATMHRHSLVPRIKLFEPMNLVVDLAEIREYSAVVCASDALALLLQSRLLALGMQLPEECSITGFDDLSMESPNPITTYAPNWKMMGRIAAELLLSHPLNIKGMNITITIKGQLVVRNSTAPLLVPKVNFPANAAATAKMESAAR